MNIKKIITVGVAGVAMGALALDNVEVTDVKARQRYPWNGKVDIDFKLDSKATEPYQMQVEVYDNIGKTNLPVKSVYTENVSVEANPCMVRTDTTRIVWDAAKDLPNGFKCTNVLVTCRDARTIAVSNLYCVIDLTTGAKEYLSGIPAGGWTDEHKTTKMVFRRIEAGSFMMGSPASEANRRSNEDYHQVVITQGFYIAIYELTEAQYATIMGTSETKKSPKLMRYGDVRGYDVTRNNYYQMVQGEFCWPISKSVDSNSLVGKLRSKTSIITLDLPTEAQWELSSRSGTVSALNTGFDSNDSNMTQTGRYEGNGSDGKGDASSSTIAEVGCYPANSVGVYDMLGNAREWCLDAWTDNLGVACVTNPVGNASWTTVTESHIYYEGVGQTSRTLSTSGRVVKGGGWYEYSWRFRYSSYTYADSGRNSDATLEGCRSAARNFGKNCWQDAGGYAGSDRGDNGPSYTCEGVRLVFSAE